MISGCRNGMRLSGKTRNESRSIVHYSFAMAVLLAAVCVSLVPDFCAAMILPKENHSGSQVNPVSKDQRSCDLIEYQFHYSGAALPGIQSTVADDKILYAGSTTGILIYDIADAAQPILAGTYDCPWVVDMVERGDTIYALTSFEALILDCTAPAHPSLVSSISFGELYQGAVRVADDLLLVGTWDGLRIYSIANSMLPVLLGYFNSGSIWDMFVSAPYAVISSYSNESRIIDFSDPTLPTEVTILPTSPHGAIDMKENMMVACRPSGGFDIYDLSDILHPALLGTRYTSMHFYDVVLGDSRAYLSGEYASVDVFDMTYPAYPPLIGYFFSELGQSTLQIALSGNLAFLSGYNGIVCVNVASPSEINRISSFARTGSQYGTKICGNLVYSCSDGYGGLNVVDNSASGSPVPVGFWPIWGTNIQIDVSSGLAAVANTSTGVHFFNVENPQLLDSLSVFSYSGSAHDVVLSGNRAFVAAVNSIWIVDVANPESPDLLAALDGFSAYGVFVKDSILYVAERNQLRLINVADPAQPAVMSSVAIQGDGSEVAVQGNLAFVASVYAGQWIVDGGLWIINVEDPSSPFVVQNYEPGSSVLTIDVEGMLAYVTFANWGMEVIDVEDPWTPCQEYLYPSIDVNTVDVEDGSVSVATAPGLRFFAQTGGPCDPESGNAAPQITSPVADTIYTWDGDLWEGNWQYQATAIDPDCDGTGMRLSFAGFPTQCSDYGNGELHCNFSACDTTTKMFNVVAYDGDLADTQQVMVYFRKNFLHSVYPIDSTLYFGQHFTYTPLAEGFVGHDPYVMYFTYPSWCELHGDTLHGYAPAFESLDVVSLFASDDCRYAFTTFHLLTYRCGDLNTSGRVDLSDVVFLVNYIFSSGPPPLPDTAAGDIDCSGSVSISDAVYLVNCMFWPCPSPCSACP